MVALRHRRAVMEGIMINDFQLSVIIRIISRRFEPRRRVSSDRSAARRRCLQTGSRPAVGVEQDRAPAWGLFVAVALAIGSLPLFVGLAVVLPVLAHSTWHLYRKVVEPDLSPRLDRHRKAKGRRYAADFPAVLFPWTHEDEP
jgi:hypothetical protein